MDLIPLFYMQVSSFARSFLNRLPLFQYIFDSFFLNKLGDQWVSFSIHLVLLRWGLSPWGDGEALHGARMTVQ